MRTYLRRRARRWGYRLHLITYCILCDGSINEARARGYGFTADRWRWHRRHERLSNGHCHRRRGHLGAHATSIGDRVWFGWPRTQCLADAHGGWRFPDCTCSPLGYGEFRRGRFEVFP